MTPFRRQLALIAAAFLVVGGVAAAVAGGGGGSTPQKLLPEAVGEGSLSGKASIGASIEPLTKDEQKQAKATDKKLPVPLERAAARLFLVGFAGTGTHASFFSRLRAREWGGVVLSPANYIDQRQFKALTGEIGAVARGARHEAPWVGGIGLGGGEATVASAGLRAQSAVSTVAGAHSTAVGAGRVLRRDGIRAVLGPAADLQQQGGPWATRGFPGQPETVARLVRGAVSGWRAAGVAPIVGHYPGEGAASQDPDIDVATVGLGPKDLAAADERPFAGVADIAPAMQLSGALYAAFDGSEPASLSPAVVKRLRAQGFKGTIVSANLTAATQATGGTVGEAAVAALKAGCDELYVPGDADDQEAAYRTVVRAVRAGLIPTSRIRDALTRDDGLRKAAGV